jgi:hypothetical protein
VRRRHRRAAVGVWAIAIVVLAVAVVRDDKTKRLAPLAWRLGSVSTDARTVGIWHEDPRCYRKLGPIAVDERRDSVKITVTQIALDAPANSICDATGPAVVITELHLRQPLATRRLVQAPGAATDPVALDPLLDRVARLQNRMCPAWRRLPANAPARDVPWAARRVAICIQPLPRALRRLPLLRRPRSRADRLPAGARSEAGRSPQGTRTDLVRGVRRPARLWLIPGPRRTCLYVTFARLEGQQSRCEPSPTVARRGTYVARSCLTGPVHARRRSLAGVVPPGVKTVRLLRNHRIVAQATVINGAWSTSSRDPTQLTYANTRLRIATQERYRCN